MASVIGRPSKYRPEYCDMLIEHRRKGFSFESFAAQIGVNRDTLYHWCTLYPEFSDARKIAHDVNLLTLETMGIGLATGQISGNTTAWIFTIKNQQNWKDQKDITISKADPVAAAIAVESEINEIDSQLVELEQQLKELDDS